jgi:DNA-binding beta-propeller fold protein YncE
LPSQVEAGSFDPASPHGAGRRARLGLLIALVAALSLAAVLLSGTAAASQSGIEDIGSPGYGAGQLQNPGGVAVSPSTGDLYVADTGGNRIDEFTATGGFVRAWGWGVVDGSPEPQVCTTECEQGLHGKGAGEMNEVLGVAVDPTDGDVLAINGRDGRVQRFSASGAYIESFGGFGAGENELTQPLPKLNDIAVGSGGQVFVADGSASRVVILDPNGDYAGQIDGETGAIATDGAGHLYVAGQYGESIRVYDETGTLESETTYFESYGTRALAPLAGGGLEVEVTGYTSTGIAFSLKEYDATGKVVGTTSLPSLKTSSSGEATSFGLAVGAAAGFPGYEPQVTYVADNVGSQVDVLGRLTPHAPVIGGTSVAGTSTAYADLSARIEPGGLATTYRFEYGPTEAYGSLFPAAAAGELAAGFGEKEVGAHLTGLTPGATYHFRLVAENAEGPVASTDRTFRTYPSTASPALPDGRVYEMVTPVEKGNNDVEPQGLLNAPGVAGEDGTGMAFSTMNGLPDAEAGGLLVGNVAKRGAEGWSSSAVSPPDINQTTLASSEPTMFSRNLDAVLVSSKLQLAPGAPKGGQKLYIRHLGSPGYELVTPEEERNPIPLENAYGPEAAVGASNDFRHVFFKAMAAFTADSQVAFAAKLYEWDEGTLRNAGVLPGETEPVTGEVRVAGPSLRPVSEDGSQVAFGAEKEGVFQVFLRIGGDRTIEVSAPETGVTDPAGPKYATFVGAAADGSSVFFTSPASLTADAETGESAGGETDLAPNLYRYDVATETLTDLTVDGEGEEMGANVGNAIVAASGQAAYFVATGVLADGATSGQENLYRWGGGEGITFISRVEPNDALVWNASAPEAVADPSGNAFAFTSTAGLAGEAEASGVPEVYHWSVGEGLECASCGSGTISQGAHVATPKLTLGSGGGNPISAGGGKVFFSTKDALVAADTNGREDVYEWEGGEDHLISTGAGEFNSTFIDASPSGKDVFFATRERLVAADTDENTDVYDAREGGGFAPAPAAGAPCEAESCRPPLAAAPAAPLLGSQSYSGPGNKKPAHHKPKKHKKKKQSKHAKKCKGKKCVKKSGKTSSTGKRG